MDSNYINKIRFFQAKKKSKKKNLLILKLLLFIYFTKDFFFVFVEPDSGPATLSLTIFITFSICFILIPQKSQSFFLFLSARTGDGSLWLIFSLSAGLRRKQIYRGFKGFCWNSKYCGKWWSTSPPTRTPTLKVVVRIRWPRTLRPNWCWMSTISPLSTITCIGLVSEFFIRVSKVCEIPHVYFSSVLCFGCSVFFFFKWSGWWWFLDFVGCMALCLNLVMVHLKMIISLQNSFSGASFTLINDNDGWCLVVSF